MPGMSCRIRDTPTNYIDPSGLLKEGDRCWLFDRDGDPYQGIMRDGRCVADGAGGSVDVTWGGDPFVTIGNAAILALWNPLARSSFQTNDLPDFVTSFYETYGEEFFNCMKKIFGKEAAEALGKQTLKNVPNIDMTKSTNQLGGLGSVGNSDLERGPRGTVNIARNITAVPTPKGGPISAFEMRVRTYAHELGNLLAGRLAGNMKAARESYGDPDGMRGSLTGQLDFDAGARFEDCTIGRFVS